VFGGGHVVLPLLHDALVPAGWMSDPIWVNSVRGVVDAVVALIGLLLLYRWRVPAIAVVSWCVVASVAAAIFSP
jgi:chromate transporter